MGKKEIKKAAAAEESTHDNLFTRAKEKRENRTQRFRRSLSNADIISDFTVQALVRRNRAKKATLYILYALLALLFCFIFVVACFSLFFRTEYVTVTGADRYDEAEIIAGSGITVGENIYATSRAEVRETLTHRFPYIASVKLKRQLPDTVTLQLREELPVYYTEICGEYFVLSSDLRILERVESRLLLKRQALTELVTYPVKKAIVGEQIVFESESYFTFLSDYLQILERSELWATGQIVYADMSDKFGVVMVYGDRFEVEFGSDDHLEAKLRLAHAIITQHYGQGEDKARINVTEDPSFAVPIEKVFYE